MSENKIPVTVKRHIDRKGGHPHVIMGDIDEKHISVGLSTKAKKGKNSPNYKMKGNVFGEETQTYMRRQATIAPKNEYKGERLGAMEEEDYKKASQYADTARKKYLANKNSGDSAKHSMSISRDAESVVLASTNTIPQTDSKVKGKNRGGQAPAGRSPAREKTPARIQSKKGSKR